MTIMDHHPPTHMPPALPLPMAPDAAVRFAAAQLEALAVTEEAAAHDAAAALGWWQHSDEAASHAEAALVLHRHARELLDSLPAHLTGGASS